MVKKKEVRKLAGKKPTMWQPFIDVRTVKGKKRYHLAFVTNVKSELDRGVAALRKADYKVRRKTARITKGGILNIGAGQRIIQEGKYAVYALPKVPIATARTFGNTVSRWTPKIGK